MQRLCKDNIKKHRLLSIALFALELVPIPYVEFIDEIWNRDIKDRPILRTALYAKADILLTGDKEFLESGINNLIIMNLAEFILLGKIDH